MISCFRLFVRTGRSLIPDFPTVAARTGIAHRQTGGKTDEDGNDGPISLVQRLLLTVCCTVLPLLVPLTSLGGDVEKLVDKLVEKGILTRTEADELVGEMQQEAARPEAAKAEAAAGSEAELPEWIGRTKFEGDLRLRYQYEDREEESRQRGRYRLRLGATSQIHDTVQLGFGLATGSGDPRSTNQTFTDSFEKPTVRVDYAFAQWQPAGQPLDQLKITGGKMPNPLWRPSDLLWDTDITPEGLAVQGPFALSSVEPFLNSGLFVIDERSSTADPLMLVVQPGFSWHLVDTVTLKLAGIYYGFMDLQGTSLDYSSGTNTMTDGGLAFEYDAYGASGQLSVKELCEFLPYLGLYGEFIRNPDPDDEGFIAGILIGQEKINRLWDWQLGYSYRRLEQDAWLDTLPDADFSGGATGTKGSEVVLNLGLAKDIWLGLDYYHSRSLGHDRETVDLLQADFNFKF